MTAAEDMHQVFINHRNENKHWIEILASNLERCGLEAQIELRPPQAEPLAEPRHGAWQECRHGIVAIPPETLEWDWALEDCETLLAQRKTDPGARTVVLLFGTPPKLPFLEGSLCVNFADPSPEGYRAAFRQVLGGLLKLPPDAPLALPDGLEIPPPPLPRLEDMAARPLTAGETDFLASVFAGLRRNRPLMLLAPADQDRVALHRAILLEARHRFGAENTFHLVPHGNADASKGEYFTYLSNQIDPNRDCLRSTDFEFLLADCLDRGKSMFLLITRLEEGSAEGRRAFSHALRNLSERYSEWLKVVLCGSEHLLELGFKEGNLSPLRKAEALLWPEPTVEDILRWQGCETGGQEEENAAALLRLTGGNARLLRRGLRLQSPSAPLDEAAVAGCLLQDSILRARFLGYLENGEATRVANLLKRDDLGHYEIWPIQASLRRLYWDGLLAERQGRFRWRCELIRQLGREVLGC